MGCALKLFDGILFIVFLFLGIVIPLFDAQSCIPSEFYPKVLVDLNTWYGNEYGDYLVVEKPDFFVGLIWMELIVLWPLSIINLFGIVYRKSWFNTTCLIFGASMTTSMVAIISELIGSGKASDTLKMIYYPFMGVAILALLRGLLCSSCETTTVSKKTILPRKKRA